MTETHALPQGFLAAGIHSGVKADANNNDLSLFVSEKPAVAAGIFTQNRVCGAPVKLSRSRVPSSSVRAVLINSGNANACTGERGDRDAQTMTAKIAEQLLECNAKKVLVCSTGVIGQYLPMVKIETGIPKLAEKLSYEPSAFLEELLVDHPWFVTVQFHPEFKSKPAQSQPLFIGFVEAAIARQHERANVMI